MTDEQQTQQQADAMLAEALKQPGVATVAAVYERITKQLPAVQPTPQKTSFALGGNLR